MIPRTKLHSRAYIGEFQTINVDQLHAFDGYFAGLVEVWLSSWGLGAILYANGDK
jgi:hypothetical protein